MTRSPAVRPLKLAAATQIGLSDMRGQWVKFQSVKRPQGEEAWPHYVKLIHHP